MFERLKAAAKRTGLFQGTCGRWRDRIFTGHVSIGPVTIYGANAMHYAARIATGEGYICARPTTGVGGHWRWYLYVSPDGTPGRAWWGTGPGFEGRGDREDRIERAFWRFDALHKQNFRDVDDRLLGPMSEREAFKYAVSTMGQG